MCTEVPDSPEVAGVMNTFDLEVRIVIVTGASGGLGAHFVETFAAAGATVVARARRAERLASLSASVPGVVPLQCDIADQNSTVHLARQALDRFDRIDVLVNNAGTIVEAPAEDESAEDFRRVIDTNLVVSSVSPRVWEERYLRLDQTA